MSRSLVKEMPSFKRRETDEICVFGGEPIFRDEQVKLVI